MPDVSNDELMKFIVRLIKKVDTIDEKLDRVLERQKILSKIHTYTEFDDGPTLFSFKPIQNQDELEDVSLKILNDEEYHSNLLHFLACKENLKLEHIFTDTFLFDYNLQGIQGKKRLEGLVPYEKVYVALMTEIGYTLEDIKRAVMIEMRQVKNKVSQQIHRGRVNIGVKEENEPVIEEHIEEEETFNDEEIIYEKMETIEDSDETQQSEQYEENDENKYNIEENPVVVEEYDYESDGEDSVFHFTPVDNENQLQLVTHKIKKSTSYLRSLRIQMINDSVDGDIKIDQLFTTNFISNYNLHGKSNKKGLSSTTLYKTVYFYLKQHLGKSLKEIEMDAANDIKKMKNRWYINKFRSRKAKNQH